MNYLELHHLGQRRSIRIDAIEAVEPMGEGDAGNTQIHLTSGRTLSVDQGYEQVLDYMQGKKPMEVRVPIREREAVTQMTVIGDYGNGEGQSAGASIE